MKKTIKEISSQLVSENKDIFKTKNKDRTSKEW
jgi:hypothetical protein